MLKAINHIGTHCSVVVLQNTETLEVTLDSYFGLHNKVEKGLVVDGVTKNPFGVIPRIPTLPPQLTTVHDSAKRFCLDLMRGGNDLRNARVNSYWAVYSTAKELGASMPNLRKQTAYFNDKNQLCFKVGGKLRVCPISDKDIGRVRVTEIAVGCRIEKGYFCYGTDNKMNEILIYRE